MQSLHFQIKSLKAKKWNQNISLQTSSKKISYRFEDIWFLSNNKQKMEERQSVLDIIYEIWVGAPFIHKNHKGMFVINTLNEDKAKY